MDRKRDKARKETNIWIGREIKRKRERVKVREERRE